METEYRRSFRREVRVTIDYNAGIVSGMMVVLCEDRVRRLVVGASQRHQSHRDGALLGEKRNLGASSGCFLILVSPATTASNLL